MAKKVAILIDGGHLRSYVTKSKLKYVPDYIEKVAHACVRSQEEIHRVLYYDCSQYEGEVTLPVSGKKQKFTKNDKWINDLSQKDYFAVRLGVLKFRGYYPKNIPIQTKALQDSDFAPKFEQKGVDMRIGLDMAIFSNTRSVDVITLVSNDTDCIPAMKHARRSGVQVALAIVPGYKPAPELLAHADFSYSVSWPAEK
jgi:uncharacterized LabA/DUF88 family protein